MTKLPFVLLALVAVPLASPLVAQNFAAPANFSQRGFVNSVGIEFLEVPSGSFVMGRFAPACPGPIDSPYPPREPNFEEKSFSPVMPATPRERAVAPSSDMMKRPSSWTPKDDAACAKAAAAAQRPGFMAMIPRSFLLGKYEVTQAQFRAVMGRNPSYFTRQLVDDADHHPVENVSWQDAQAFVTRLNVLEGGNYYRLPAEAEWEWAARAGTEQIGGWTLLASRDTSDHGVFRAFSDEPNLRWTTAVVGSKKPNAWGFYDMLGNVMEWVADVYNGKYYPELQAVSSGRQTEHVLKGKSFLTGSIFATPYDHSGGPSDKIDVGFRVARSFDGIQEKKSTSNTLGMPPGDGNSR